MARSGRKEMFRGAVEVLTQKSAWWKDIVQPNVYRKR